ncbi:MAG: hypothetical protein H6819_09885 [Phycisphaerales bacterium]|nr:hypothetical protein [Phycisphaerales bacterium]MCB9857958.1 hypothetical protein [Phycisphaerales bacterium]MCB9864949.1 hypothetical protein [Phycisphaerales bacterium]
MMTKRRLAVGMLGLLVFGTGMMSEQCQQNPSLEGLAGLWTLERGATSVRVTFSVNNGGEVTENSASSDLQPLDPNDFPEQLADLIAQWNAGLDDVNAALDEALPDVVGVEFPQFGVMRIFDPNDTTMAGQGLINSQTLAYGFVGDLSGAGAGDEQGGGGVLQASSIAGSFDAMALTTTGEIARTLLVSLQNNTNNSGLTFTAQIAIAYTGQRTGDLPEDTGGNSNANDNSSDNSNTNDNGG